MSDGRRTPSGGPSLPHQQTLPPFIKSFSSDQDPPGTMSKEASFEKTKLLKRQLTIHLENGEDEKTMIPIDAVCGECGEEECTVNHDHAAEEEEKPQDGCRVDTLFYKICWLCMVVGVNFYRYRSWWQKCISCFIVGINVAINVYFMVFVALNLMSAPFNAETIAISLGMITLTLQSTCSTVFLGYWQYNSIPCGVLRQLYAAHKGKGIAHHRRQLVRIVVYFYVAFAAVISYIGFTIVANIMDYKILYLDENIKTLLGDSRLFVIFQLSELYTMVCWAVALFIFVLLIQATQYEFAYFNEEVRSIRLGEASCTDDEKLCSYLIELIKVHNRLTDCVKRLDKMFHRYAFVMIATIIPTAIFALFMMFRKGNTNMCVLFSFPVIGYCVFSFFAITNAPSQLHKSIYDTKSALCSNTNIWFPYRPNVYHSALAFVCHLDQANLGVTIWGFAVVSKPLILTTLSVMVTCLALFLQVGECSAGPLTKAINDTIVEVVSATA